MIFRPELARKIRAGYKTMTRRPRKAEPVCRYQPGKSYAVQPGRGKSAVCRIRVRELRCERLGDIAFPDARQEGFATTEDFKAYWVSLYEKKWLDGEISMLEDAENDDGVVLDRELWLMRRSLDIFDQRHAERSVWVISFRLDVEPVGRFLAARSDELYTSNPARALSLEPEAVDEDAQKSITERAWTVQRQWASIEHAHRDRDRALLTREDQIVRLRRAARLRSIDASRELWALQNMVASANDNVFSAKVRKAEAKVFRVAA